MNLFHVPGRLLVILKWWSQSWILPSSFNYSLLGIAGASFVSLENSGLSTRCQVSWMWDTERRSKPLRRGHSLEEGVMPRLPLAPGLDNASQDVWVGQVLPKLTLDQCHLWSYRQQNERCLWVSSILQSPGRCVDVEVQDMGFGREAVWLLRKCVGLEVRQTWNGSCSSLHGFRHFVLLFVKGGLLMCKMGKIVSASPG